MTDDPGTVEAVAEARRTMAGLLLLLHRGLYEDVDLLLGQTDAAGTAVLVRILLRELHAMHRGIAHYLDADLDGLLASQVTDCAGGPPS